MSTTKPTAAESAKWHREQAGLHRLNADVRGVCDDSDVMPAAHHEAAAERDLEAPVDDGRQARIDATARDLFVRLRASDAMKGVADAELAEVAIDAAKALEAERARRVKS